METSLLAEVKDGSRTTRTFAVESQSVTFEVDFERQKIRGRTEIRVQPNTKDSRTFQFNCRQCTIKSATVEGKPASYSYDDPYLGLRPNPNFTVHQHHFLKAKVDEKFGATSDTELAITLPRRVEIKESEQYKALKREHFELADSGDATGRYASLTIAIDFETTGLRDGLQWVGCVPGDSRWPHVYTKNSSLSGTACCLFPCIDDVHSRNPWNISINCPRTLGDAFCKRRASEPSAGTESRPQANGITYEEGDTGLKRQLSLDIDDIGLSEQDKELEISIASSGELTGESADPNDSSRKIHHFSIPSSVSANQIGFAIGPFEDVDLSEFREVDDDEKLGEAAIRVHGFCLPGRAAEVRNACMPLAKAIDFFTTTFTTYTGESFKLCFVDDSAEDIADTAGLAICSTRLLFPDDIMDLLTSVTRTLIFALATQWSGIHLVPRALADSWAVAGIATFMTDIFLKSLMGKNEYRYHQKLAADRVYDQDLNRPSLYDLGKHLELDPEERRFMTLKAGVIFFILDQRFLKTSGTSGMVRVVGRILNSAKSEESESSFLSTEKFIYQCTKSGHQKLDNFFNQWVYASGCPSFQVLQEMNKKKLQILMTFTQTHMERARIPKDLDPRNFLRETKEELKGVWAGDIPPAFVGPMTISIHEADGTPYDHTVEIPNQQHWVTQIPYNTKYKRMKRGRRQRERNRAMGAESGDAQEDILLYSLGDGLQTEEEIAEWRLSDWDPDMEQKMGEESYEWIRMDADFEWICKMSIKMPAYMWMSQLQQDKDVVAQMESLQWVSYETKKAPHPLISTYLLRTLLDKRYFHGIRTMAAERLPNCAKQEVDWIGLFHLKKAFQELYCVSPDSPMPRPNDFSDRSSYIVQCAILQGLADVRDNAGRTPAEVKEFFMDKLKFNDNSSNDYSDSFYVSRLMLCLTNTLLSSSMNEDEQEDADAFVLQRNAISEIQRYKRINEWTPSFHNVFTTTALDCLVKLAKADVVKPNYKEFLMYTRADHADQVRIKAFECLVELGMLKKDSIMAYMLHELSTDPSPFVRENLFKLFSKGLGQIAMGNETQERPAPVGEGGLVIEQESSYLAVDTQAHLERRQTINGAMKALKAELGENVRLKEAIWMAVKSPVLSARELSNLLHFCSIIFEAQNGYILTLKLPRFWNCEHLGDGRVVFRQTGSVRTRPIVRKQWIESKPSAPVKPPAAVAPIPRPTPARKPSLASNRRRSSSSTVATPGPVLLTNGNGLGATPQSEAPKRMVLKLKVGKGTSSAFPPVPAMSTSVSTTPHAPFGFGTISSSPTAHSPELPPLGGMSPPPRPPSAASASTTMSGKRRKSSSTAPPSWPAAASIPLEGSAIEDTGSASPPFEAQNGAVLGFAPIQNGTKKRKSETPTPLATEEPPAKKPMLKIKLKGVGIKKEDPGLATPSPAPQSR